LIVSTRCLLERHVGNGGILLYAGIGDKNVDGAELAPHAREHVLDLGGDRDICLVRRRRDTAALNGAHGFFGGGGRGDIVDEDVGAGMTQRDGHRTPDAGAGAGDKGFLAGKRPLRVSWRAHGHRLSARLPAPPRLDPPARSAATDVLAMAAPPVDQRIGGTPRRDQRRSAEGYGRLPRPPRSSRSISCHQRLDPVR